MPGWQSCWVAHSYTTCVSCVACVSVCTQVIPVEASRLKLVGTVRVPVYVTQARCRAMGVGLVMEADLATDMHSSHWVLQGAALVLNIDR